jgi:hypothetical protein
MVFSFVRGLLLLELPGPAADYVVDAFAAANVNCNHGANHVHCPTCGSERPIASLWLREGRMQSPCRGGVNCVFLPIGFREGAMNGEFRVALTLKMTVTYFRQHRNNNPFEVAVQQDGHRCGKCFTGRSELYHQVEVLQNWISIEFNGRNSPAKTR